MKRIWRKYTLSLISLPLLLIILACAGGEWDPDDVRYSFFAPEVSGAEDQEFFKTWHYLYGNNDFNPADEFLLRNVDEWNDWFKGLVKKEDLKQLLYSASLGSLDSLLHHIKSRKKPLPPSLMHNSIVAFKDTKKTSDFLYYLGFAKRTEDYFKRIDYWYWEEKKQEIDTVSREKLLAGGMKQFSIQKDPFVKERYLFQLIRLQYNAGKYKECTQLMDQYHTILKSESMEFRSLGYAAAALYKQQKYAEANYLYSQIYLKSDLMDVIAIQSFHPMSERDWNQCLVMGNTPEEKATLWYMLGIYSEDNLRAMKEIAAIQPGSPYLDLLLTRALNAAEENCLPETGSMERVEEHATIKSTEKEKALLQFCQEQVKQGKVKNKAFWTMACGYIQVLQTRYFDAEESFRSAEDLAGGNTELLNQIRLFRFVNYLNTSVPTQEEWNTKVVQELTWLQKSQDPLRKNDAWRWSVRQLAHLQLTERKDTLLFHLVNGAMDEQYAKPHSFYASSHYRKKMIALMDKKIKTPFEQYFLDLYPVKKKDIYELMAIEKLYSGDLSGALQTFREGPGSGDGVLNGDPFLIHIRDCHDCDHAAPQPIKYTKQSFVEKMIALATKSKKEPSKAAECYFEMANGFYNMSYFGNGRVIYAAQLNNNYVIGDYHNAEKKDLINEMDCSRAEKYYTKAASLSKDKEFKAKCYFMAAKCEMNTFYATLSWNSEEAPVEIRNFDILKDSLYNTQYYKEIIRECTYFSAYSK